MNRSELDALLLEAGRRADLQKDVDVLKSSIYDELFKQQLDFVSDSSRRKAVLGSRRSGKTSMWTRYATVTALENPRALIRIWHSSRLRAKEMLWAEFRWLHERHGIKSKFNDTELTITLPNEATIKLVGADKDKEAQKKRGDKTILEILLEVQNFAGYLRQIIDDIVDPCLVDLNGTLCVEGTPGALCQGVWFEISGGNNTAYRWVSTTGNWHCYRWTLLDNPHLPHAKSYLERIKKERRWTDDNPTYLREWCGKWADDKSALYYKFDGLRNTYDTGRIVPYGKGWNHALGWDLGAVDSMAIVIWGWHDEYDGIYEVFSWKESGALADKVMSVIQEQETAKNLNFIEQVADTGGGGRMYVEEVMSRYTRPFSPAKKTEKYEHVRLMNDDYLTGRIKLIPGSPLQLEVQELIKDPDWPPPDKPDAKPREDPRCENHCCDAALYSWRAGTPHFKWGKEPEAPLRSSPDWVHYYVKQLDKQALKVRENDGVTYGFGAGDDEI